LGEGGGGGGGRGGGGGSGPPPGLSSLPPIVDPYRTPSREEWENNVSGVFAGCTSNPFPTSSVPFGRGSFWFEQI